VVAVKDQGIGIPAQDLPKVFDWFHRGHNVGTTPGSGVGLASAKLIVEKHGGSIEVRSRPKHGTTVTLRLPMHPAQREEQEVVDGPTPRAVARASAGPG